MDHHYQNPLEPGSKPAIALLGGVFDPPHQGHIDIGLSALQLPQVDEVRWIPCAEIPHHKAPPTAPAQARLKMVELICQGIDGFSVDDVEYRRQGPSYTVDTVKALSEAFPDQTLLWIVGADNSRSMARWKSAAELWQIAIPVVARDPAFLRPQPRLLSLSVRISPTSLINAGSSFNSGNSPQCRKTSPPVKFDPFSRNPQIQKNSPLNT